MENNIPVAVPAIHNRKNWKKAYFTMRGWAFILATTSILFAICFAYAITRPKTITPAYEIIATK